jgi:hypothetical protein
MEFFLPSILVLLVAAAIVFFVIPRFGPLVLAVVSLLLLGIGIYNHYSMFQNEYRLSTWQLGAVAYAPYLLIGVVILMIILYLTYLLPSGSSSVNASSNANANANVKPNTINLPPPETATNVITEGANNAIRAAANLANVKVNTTNQPNNPANLGIFGNINNNNNNNNLNINNRGNGRANRNPYSPPFL